MLHPVLQRSRILLIFLGLLSSIPGGASVVELDGPEDLVSHYRQLKNTGPELARNLPIYLSTRQLDNVLTVSLIGELPFPFSEVTEVLARPDSYCEFLPLMFNVKSCVVTDREPVTRIKYYVAGKYYAPPLTSFRINSVFRLLERRKNFLRINLESDEDTLGNSRYGVKLQIAPLGEHTLILVDSVYAPGRLTRIATHTYIKVFARDKLGFTEIREPVTNRTRLITGFPAIIERSSVRAYLALKAMMINRPLVPARQYEARLQSWYDLNQPYNKQLYELDRQQYLDIKRRERQNQLRLQQRHGQSAAVKVGLLGFND